MATKPKRSDFGAGRQGLARYQQAMRTWSSSQRSATTTKNTAPGTGRSRAQRSRTTPAKKPQLKTIPAKDRPKDMQAGKVYGNAGQPPAPKLPPKPTARKNVTPKPTKPVKKKPSVSGVGPIKDGRKYSVQVSGKTELRQTIDEIRKMGPNSESSKKLREEAKQKSLAQSKKNRERRTPNPGRRARGRS